MKKRYIVGKTESTKQHFYQVNKNIYEMKPKEAMNEAVLLFTGEMILDDALLAEKNQENRIAYLDRAVEDADLCFAQVAVRSDTLEREDRIKTGLDFMEILKEAGFAGALYLGRGALPGASKDLKSRFGLLSRRKTRWIIYQVNDISVGIVSYADDETENLVLAIDEAKAAGAAFIIVFAKVRPREDAKAIAAAGADYIIMHSRKTLGRYYTLNLAEEKNSEEESAVQNAEDTATNRCVRVMTSLGKNLTSDERSEKSILLKIRLLRDGDGKISVEDEYIPCTCIKDFKTYGTAIVPTRQYYNRNYRKKELRELNVEIKETIGKKLKLSEKTLPIKNKSGFQPQVSIEEICEILGVSTDFYHGSYPLDKKVHSIVIRKTELDKGCVAVFATNEHKINITAELAKEAGALFAISKKPEDGLDTLIVEDPTEAFITLAKAIRKKYNPFTIGITGTVGKSTTTDLIKSVIKQNYHTLDVRGNYNYYKTVGFCIQKLSPKHTAYVQELHGGTQGAAKLGSNMILPNACVITNIGDAHLSQVGTIDDVLREKLGVIDALQPGGALFVNSDNTYLQNLELPDVKIVTYAVQNQNADYYAQNVVDYGDRIKFQIVCAEGVFDAIVYCPGIHNVGNAIAAFAVGRFAGIEPHRIIAGISRYRTSGIRQNIVKMDGYKIVVDCFSATPDSMYSSMKSFSLLAAENQGKHIAMIGDVADLAEKSEYWHKEFGKLAAELGIDVVITLGEKAKATAIVARECGVEAYDYVNRDEFEDKICEIIRPGDNLLFKSSHPIDLAKSVENLFGIK